MADMIIGAFQEGDNADVDTIITNPTSASPAVELHPYTSNAGQDFNWQMAMQSFDGVLAKTPTFKFVVAGDTPTFHGSTFQLGGGTIINPQFSRDGINWTKFDTRFIDGSNDLNFSHSTAFTSDTVQISLTEMWTWKRIRYRLDNVWDLNPWVSEVASSVSYGGSKYVLGVTPTDTDTYSRVYPVQEWVGFKIAHPDFVGTYRRKLVCVTGVHVAEHSGMTDLVRFIDDLLDASENSSDANQAQAYEILRYFDIYCYPLTNPSVYFSDYDQYWGDIAAGYNFGGAWDNPNATLHTPLRTAINSDIDNTAEVALSFHSTTSNDVTGFFYQREAIDVTSLTRSGSTVTAVISAVHGLSISDYIIIENSGISDYNGAWRLDTVATTTTFTFDIGAATPANEGAVANIAKTDPLGEDPVWEALYGTKKYWYDTYMDEIETDTTNNSSDNAGALREYGRQNWGASICMSTESGQWAERPDSEVKTASLAVMNVINRLVENGHTGIPRPSAKAVFK